jgi:hypothetical protein
MSAGCGKAAQAAAEDGDELVDAVVDGVAWPSRFESLSASVVNSLASSSRAYAGDGSPMTSKNSSRSDFGGTGLPWASAARHASHAFCRAGWPAG